MYGSPAHRSPIGLRNQRMNKRKQRYRFRMLLFIVIVLLVIAIAVYSIIILLLPAPIPSKPHTEESASISISVAPDREVIGISDGSYAFDMSRKNAGLKKQAADMFKTGKNSVAQDVWMKAAAMDTRDAETLIYLEDQRVLNMSHHYMTFIVGTILTGKFAASGNDSLQGAYTAQREYNDQCLKSSSCVPARLLIANSGSGDTASDEIAYASLIAEQIVQAHHDDKTIVGVMGWPASSDLVYGSTTFAEANLPVVSPTALLNASTPPYIFSVAPSNTRQGIVGAYYAEHMLHARRAIVFVDPVDRYSESLAEAFSKQFTVSNSNAIVATENYKVGLSQTVQTAFNNAQNYKFDLIYFAGHSNDIGPILTSIPDCNSPSCYQLLGGDGLYELGGYSVPNVKNLLSRVHFTSFAYPDEWGILGGSIQAPDFFSEYSQNFNPQGTQPQGSYGYTRADNNVILSYDALIILLRTATTIFNNQESTFSPADLQKALTTQNRQGVSGQISFGPDGNPVDKAIVVLYFDQGGRVHQDRCFGVFLKSASDNATSSNCLQI